MTYLTLDSRFGITTFDPSNGYPILTDFSELIDDADIIPILEIASQQVPPVYILVSDVPITTPEDGVSAADFVTSNEFAAALARLVSYDPQTVVTADQTQARTNIDAEEDGGGTGAVRYDIDQTSMLTAPQKLQARNNIGVSSSGGSSLALPGYISVYDPAIGTPAVGDDTADDTAALNAAETYALAHGLLGVDLGHGIFKITGPVKFSTAVRGAGGNESTACVIRCHSATASVNIGYVSAGDTVHARVATGFIVDANGTGDPASRFVVYNVKGIIMDVNATDLSVTGSTVSAMTPGNMVTFNGAQNVESIQLNASGVQGSALILDNGVGGCKFSTCHFDTAGTLVRITDQSPGSANTGFPFGPADNSFDNCILETRLADSVQLLSVETGSMNLFTNTQFSVSTGTGVLTSGAMVNISSDVLYKGLFTPFQSHVAFGDGCSWNGGAKGAVAGTNPVNIVSMDGAQVVDFDGVQYAQDYSAIAYNKAGAGSVSFNFTRLITGGGAGARTGASASLSDSKQSIEVGTGVTSYTMTFAAQTSSGIGPADTAASIQTKLQALSSIGAGNVTVSGENGAYIAHFTGSKAGAAQALMTTTPTGGTVTVTSVQVGGVTPSLTGYSSSTSGQFRVGNGFSRNYHLTAVTTAAFVFSADVSAYSEIEFAYVSNAVSLGTLTLINAVDGQLFTITHLQSAQGEATYVWPSNVVFRGPTPFEYAASGIVSVTFRYNAATNSWFEVGRSGSRQIDLPPYAGALQHHYDPAGAGYNFNGKTLHKLRAAFAKTIAGVSDTHIFFLGDSSLGGYNGTAYFYDTCVPRSMGKALASKLGITFQQGIQYAIGDKTSTADNWAHTGAAGLNSIFLESTGVSTMTRTALTGETGTTIDVYYSGLSSAGVTWKVDGAVQSAFAVTGTNTINKTTLSGLTNTTHTIEIDGAASKVFILLGTRVYNPAVKSVYVHNLSIGGSRANGGANDLNWSSTSSTGTVGIGFIMPALIAASGLTPDFLIVSIGGNDIANGEDAPTTMAGVDTIFGYESSAAGLLMHSGKVSGVTDAVWDLLSKAKFDHADSLGKAMFNWDDYIQGLATATADGLIGADGTHPTVPHQMLVGTQLANLLSK